MYIISFIVSKSNLENQKIYINPLYPPKFCLYDICSVYCLTTEFIIELKLNDIDPHYHPDVRDGVSLCWV